MAHQDRAKSVLVLYGSETGNSQDIAEEVGRLCQRLHFSTAVEEMNDVKLVSVFSHHPMPRRVQTKQLVSTRTLIVLAE